MTVHFIEIVASNDVDSQKVQNKIDDLKSKYGEKLKNYNDDLKPMETVDGLNYYMTRFRIILSDKDAEKKDLTEQMEKEADKSASWWRVKWHECVHDENQSTGCSTGYENSAGAVPDKV